MKQTTPAEFRAPGRHAMKAWLRALQCWCGHYRDAHSHYRYGTECALCGCQRWAPPRWWQRTRILRLSPDSLILHWPTRAPLNESFFTRAGSGTYWLSAPGPSMRSPICALRRWAYSSWRASWTRRAALCRGAHRIGRHRCG